MSTPPQPAGPDDSWLEPDPVIDAYKPHVDRTLVREQLRRSVDERVRNMVAALRFAERLRAAACRTDPSLIRLKRAAGRPKDLEALAELEILLEEQRRAERT